MGDYLTVYLGTSTAGPKAVEWDKTMIVGDGQGILTDSKVYELTPDDWQTQLIDDGFTTSSTLYKSAAVYFMASPSPQRLFALTIL